MVIKKNRIRVIEDEEVETLNEDSCFEGVYFKGKQKCRTIVSRKKEIKKGLF